MRFKFGHLAVVLAAVSLVVGACSSADSDSDSSSSSSAGPVTITHQYGTTEIPSTPSRPVTLNWTWADSLIKLDVPITAEFVLEGYSGENNRFEWTPEHSSTVVPYTATPDIATLAKYKPDVILAGFLPDKASWERLQQIAPTIPVLEQGTQVDSWEDVTTTAGEIFDKRTQAADAVAEVNDQLAQVKSTYPKAQGKTFSFAQFTQENQLGVITSDSDAASKLMGQMGLVLDPAVKSLSPNGDRTLVSPERIDVLRSDLLILWPLAGGPEAFEKVPGFTSLPAVQRGSTVYLDNTNAAAFSSPSIYSVPWAIKKVEPALAKIQ